MTRNNKDSISDQTLERAIKRKQKGNEQVRFDQRYRKGKGYIGLDKNIQHKHNKGCSSIDIEINRKK